MTPSTTNAAAREVPSDAMCDRIASVIAHFGTPHVYEDGGNQQLLDFITQALGDEDIGRAQALIGELAYEVAEATITPQQVPHPDALEDGTLSKSTHKRVSALKQQGGEQEALKPSLSDCAKALDEAVDVICDLTGERRAFITDDVRFDHLYDSANKIFAIAAALRSKQAASEGDVARAAEWIREANWSAKARPMVAVIEEALAAYDPERMARCGNTSKQVTP